MTDLGRRGEFRPPGYIEEIEVSRMAVFVAGVHILIERAKQQTRNDTPEIVHRSLAFDRRL